MADKLNEFAKNLGKGGGPAPKGLGLLAKLGVVGLGLVYGAQNSFYTGMLKKVKHYIIFTKIQFCSSNSSGWWSPSYNFQPSWRNPT